MEEINRRLYIKKLLIKSAACFNLLLFWIIIFCLFVIAIEKPSFFENLKTTAGELITILTAITVFLTGKNHYDLKSKSFEEVFSSWKAFIPSIILMFSVSMIVKDILYPSKIAIRVEIRNEKTKSLDVYVPCQGSAALYAITKGNSQLISTTEVTGPVFTLIFYKPENVDLYKVDVQIINKFNRLLLDSASFYVNPDEISLTDNYATFKKYAYKQNPVIKFNTGSYEFSFPEYIKKLLITDISDFGKCYERTITGENRSAEIINGKYRFSMLDGNGKTVRTNDMILDNSVAEKMIKLPVNSREVRFVINNGNLLLHGEGFLGNIEIKNNQRVRLLDSDYDYVLSAKYYKSKSGKVSIKNTNADGDIVMELTENDREKSTVCFLTILPDGESVDASLFIENIQIGKTQNPLILKNGIYKNLRFIYYDTLLVKGKKFRYQYGIDLLEINGNITREIILQLK